MIVAQTKDTGYGSLIASMVLALPGTRGRLFPLEALARHLHGPHDSFAPNRPSEAQNMSLVQKVLGHVNPEPT